MQQVGFPDSVRDAIGQARRPAQRDSSNAGAPLPSQAMIFPLSEAITPGSASASTGQL